MFPTKEILSYIKFKWFIFVVFVLQYLWQNPRSTELYLQSYLFIYIYFETILLGSLDYLSGWDYKCVHLHLAKI